MRRFFLRAVVVSIALLFLSTCVSAQDLTTVRVVGLSASQGPSLSAQRESAIQDALRNAVQQVVGVLISTSTLVENYELIEDRVYSRAAGVAILSRVVEEGPMTEGTYRVVAEVAVREADLALELHAVIRANGDPRVLVEASGGTLATRSLTEVALEDALLRSGFSVVVSATARSAGGARVGALQVGADLLASVEIAEHENVSTPAVLRDAGLVSVTVGLVVRLVESGSGRVVAVERASSTRVGSSPEIAAHEAALSASAALGDTMAASAAAWLQGAGVGQRVSILMLEGEFGYTEVQDLTEELEMRHGATTSLRTFGPGHAVLEVSVSGRVQSVLAVLTELGWDIAAVDGMNITARRD